MRYRRQIALPGIGASGQDRLSRCRVLCVGVGGLGSASAQYLAAAGVGTIGLVDHDVVEESNLHRQIIFSGGDVGRPKVEAAKDRLSSLSPAIEILTFSRKLDSGSASIVSGFDLIVEGSDDFATKLVVSDACAALRKPFVIASASGFAGQLAVFPAGASACFRCIFGEKAEEGAVSCDGILGAVTGTIGSLQALEAIKLIVSPEGRARLISFDGESGALTSFAISARPGCLGCKGAFEIASPPAGEISATDAIRAAGLGAIFLDVREEGEAAGRPVPGWLPHPLSRLIAGELPDLPRQAELVVACAAGAKSRTACRILARAGFARATSLNGGVAAYEAAISERAPSR